MGFTKKPPKAIERPGLENVITGPTRLCRLDPKHQTLEYCGYSVAELVERASFEEVAYLLLHGDLPTPEQNMAFDAALHEAFFDFIQTGEMARVGYMRLLHEGVQCHPMHMLRSLVSGFGAIDMARRPQDSPRARAARLLAIMPLLVAILRPMVEQQEEERGEADDVDEAVPVSSFYSVAEAFLGMYKGAVPDPVAVDLLDDSLVLYAEHEFNVGTHTLHAITSANADLYSAVCGAIGALSGDLHGGANEAALELLQEIAVPERAEAVLAEKMRIANEQGVTIKGFGHPVYKDGDPRCAILKPRVRALAEKTGRLDFYRLAERVEEIMLAIKPKKPLHPNVDYWMAALYELIGIPKDLFTPLFALGRTAGWCAHYIEYNELDRDSRGRLVLIRPRARYAGHPSRNYIPFWERNDGEKEV